ncbi:MAG: GNAT family N-acetyltransferase [Oscillatoriales cyanobacterium]|nr:MAG: GNAT family N-acetyltransferase [Oscillatoriales cyanobacterium]TAH24331.1 MAG: GNAT family N-acetyltransferase [Oscillatoriales cyanobacterium]
MDFKIRLSKPEDSEKIIELQTSSLRVLSSSYNLNQVESLVRSQASARFAQNEIGFVAEHENEIVGFASYLTHPSQISGVYVHPNLIRQGIGTRLLKAVEKIAIDRGYKAIQVFSSLAGVSFYHANGYQSIRQSGFYSEQKTWIPCVILKKQLITVPIAQQVYQPPVSLPLGLKPLFPAMLFLVTLYLVVVIGPIVVSFIRSFFR